MSSRQLNLYQLYEVTKEHNQLLELLEIAPLEREAIEQALAFSTESFADVITQLVAIEDEDALMLEAVEKRIKELQARADRYKRRSSNLKKSILNAFLAADIQKLDTPTASISLSLSGGSAAILDTNELPVEYLIQQEPKIDKQKLLKDLRKGESIPGAILEIRESLRIKRK